MDFSLSEDQQSVKDLARQILEGTISPSRLSELSANGEHIERRAWQELANANLVGIANDQIRSGMPVEIVFEDATGEVTLAKFRPAGGGRS